MPLTNDQLTDEVQDFVDTCGATYIEDAIDILSRGGIPELEAELARLRTALHFHPPLKLFVFDLALACAKNPATPTRN